MKTTLKPLPLLPVPVWRVAWQRFAQTIKAADVHPYLNVVAVQQMGETQTTNRWQAGD